MAFGGLLVVAALLAPGQKAQGAQAVYAKAVNSVVEIEATTPDGVLTGTGFFYKDSQTVATCWHVVEDATRVVVRTKKGKTFGLSSIRYNIGGDTALLRLSAKTSEKPLAIGATPKVGDAVNVIGHPAGATYTLSTGIVSALRKLQALPIVQVSAAISQGSSGSPALNNRGQVVGMITSYLEGAQNLNIAVGTDVLKWAADGKNVMSASTLYSLNRPLPTLPDRSAGLRISSARRCNHASGEFVTAIILQRAKFDFAFEELLTSWSTKREFDAQAAKLESLLRGDQLLPTLEAESAIDTALIRAACQQAIASFRSLRDAYIKVSRPGADIEASTERTAQAMVKFEADVEEIIYSIIEASWFDAEQFSEKVTSHAKGQFVLNDWYALASPGASSLCLVSEPMLLSELEKGDLVVAFRLRGQEWEKVMSWDDLFDKFIDLSQREKPLAELQVRRGTRLLTIKHPG